MSPCDRNYLPLLSLPLGGDRGAFQICTTSSPIGMFNTRQV